MWKGKLFAVVVRSAFLVFIKLRSCSKPKRRGRRANVRSEAGGKPRPKWITERVKGEEDMGEMVPRWLGSGEVTDNWLTWGWTKWKWVSGLMSPSRMPSTCHVSPHTTPDWRLLPCYCKGSNSPILHRNGRSAGWRFIFSCISRQELSLS